MKFYLGKTANLGVCDVLSLRASRDKIMNAFPEIVSGIIVSGEGNDSHLRMLLACYRGSRQTSSTILENSEADEVCGGVYL